MSLHLSELPGRHSFRARVLSLHHMQVRLLSQNRHELLRRVPDGLADVFRIGSTAPGQWLAPKSPRGRHVKGIAVHS